MAYDDLSPEILEQLELAEQLKLEGQNIEALMILEDLLMDDPENVAVLEEIADNELSLCQFERAQNAAYAALELDQESYTAHYIVGFLQSRVCDWPCAVASLRRANALKANNPEILRCLGWALFQSGERAQGMVTLERALNLDSDSALTLCDLGVAHLQQQDHAKAKLLFERALEIEPENPRARECLQMTLRITSLPMEKSGAAVG